MVRKIEKNFEESHKTYGYRVIREGLKRENIEISECRVRKIMKENGFYPETRKKCNPARNRKKAGLIFHSGRGSQYASKGYQKMLEENQITGSMSRGGCPYDNSCVESFFATLKKERIYRKNYVTMEEVKADLFRYIELLMSAFGIGIHEPSRI